jgi:fibronectin type III domain protein
LKGISFVKGFPPTARKRAVVILCGLLLSGLAFSASRWGWLFQGRSARRHSHSVDLKWKASASPVVGYYVYRSDKSQGPYIKLNSTPAPMTSYTDTTVQGGHTYFYKVTAVDTQGRESMFSAQIRAVVPSP